MSTTSRRFATLAVHGGDPHPRLRGAITPPIWQTSTFESPEEGSSYDAVRYTRLSNTPSHEALHERVALLEGTETALACASGMAAISAALLSHLSSGDHLIAHRSLYGGTFDLVVRDLPRLGIDVTLVDTSDRQALESARRAETRAIYTEAIVNPTLEVPDHDVVVAFAKQHGLVSMIDSTFASPYLFRPASAGYDIVLHSATKYLNGHGDVIAGVVAGSHQAVARVHHTLNLLGGSLDPHACFLLSRGIRTLHLRMQRQCENALELAQDLERHPRVSRVYYPMLESHPSHERALRFLRSGGGVVSFDLENADRAREFLARVRLAANAPSLGGVDTLVSRPAALSHLGLTEQERAAAGVGESMIRVAVGVEDAADLLDDFRQALDS